MRTALAEVKGDSRTRCRHHVQQKVTGGVEIVAAVDYQSQVPGPKDAPVRRQLNEESVNISSAGKQMTRSAPPRNRTNTTPIPWRPCWPASRSSIRQPGG